MSSGQPEVDVFVGIDVAKENHYAHAVSGSGAELFDLGLGNDQRQVEALIDKAEEYGRCFFVVDMTSSNAQLLLSTAAQRGVNVAYVSGLQMRRAADLYAGQAKTDPRDAWILADYAMRNKDRLTWVSVSDEFLTELKVLNGRDTDLASDSNKASNRCRDALVAVSPSLERILGPKLHIAGVRDLVGKFSTPKALKELGKTRIRNLIKKRSPRSASQLADQVWDALQSQTVTLPAETAWGQVISELGNDLDRIYSQRASLGEQIEQVYLSHPLGVVLDSMCGFGPKTGARTLAEIGDPHRFANGGRLAAYAGLAPTDRRSGKSLNSTRRSRGGNHRLKNALFQSAFIASRYDPDAKAFYEKKIGEGKKHSSAVICLARRRCDIILAMLKNQAKYEPTIYQKSA